MTGDAFDGMLVQLPSTPPPPFPPPPSQASKAKLGNRARKAISPLASSKDRKCVKGTGPSFSQQTRPSGYNNKLICVSAAGEVQSGLRDSSGAVRGDGLRMWKQAAEMRHTQNGEGGTVLGIPCCPAPALSSRSLS